METETVGCPESSGRSTSGRPLAPALWKLYVRLGRESDAETGRRLASMALDAAPHSIEALDLLAQLTPAEDRAELCARYDAFLSEVPFHPQAPRVREALIHLLLEYGHYDLALHHVDAVSKESWAPLASDEIARACDVREPEPEHEPEQDDLEPLDEFDLEPFEVVYEVADYELIDAVDAAE